MIFFWHKYKLKDDWKKLVQDSSDIPNVDRQRIIEQAEEIMEDASSQSALFGIGLWSLIIFLNMVAIFFRSNIGSEMAYVRTTLIVVSVIMMIVNAIAQGLISPNKRVRKMLEEEIQEIQEYERQNRISRNSSSHPNLGEQTTEHRNSKTSKRLNTLATHKNTSTSSGQKRIIADRRTPLSQITEYIDDHKDDSIEDIIDGLFMEDGERSEDALMASRHLERWIDDVINVTSPEESSKLTQHLECLSEYKKNFEIAEALRVWMVLIILQSIIRRWNNSIYYTVLSFIVISKLNLGKQHQVIDSVARYLKTTDVFDLFLEVCKKLDIDTETREQLEKNHELAISLENISNQLISQSNDIRRLLAGTLATEEVGVPDIVIKVPSDIQDEMPKKEQSQSRYVLLEIDYSEFFRQIEQLSIYFREAFAGQSALEAHTTIDNPQIEAIADLMQKNFIAYYAMRLSEEVEDLCSDSKQYRTEQAKIVKEFQKCRGDISEEVAANYLTKKEVLDMLSETMGDLRAKEGEIPAAFYMREADNALRKTINKAKE